MLANFHQIPRFWKFLVNFYQNSTHRNFLKFGFKFHVKSGQVPMGKIVPYLTLLLSIFLLEFLEPGKSPLLIKLF
jgi:hypothetical protein